MSEPTPGAAHDASAPGPDDAYRPPAAARAPRSVEEWATLVATGAVVLGGFLVSLGAPVLRRQIEAQRAQLGAQAAELAALGEAPPPVEAPGDEPGDDAAVWAAAVHQNGAGLTVPDRAPSDG